MRLILFLLLSFSSSSVWAMGHLPAQAAVESPLIGKAAPDAFLAASDGTSDSVMSSRQRQKAIVIFWATWCPNCYGELGSLNSNIASIEEKGIKIILVDLGETKEDVKKYFNRRQMKLTSFIDADNVLQGPYHLVGIPTLVFIDENGIVRSVTHEFPSDYENYFNQ
jgi:cytochrome c biogenesis protein CcmG/thiol:disulfide interchange protein DsbE